MAPNCMPHVHAFLAMSEKENTTTGRMTLRKELRTGNIYETLPLHNSKNVFTGSPAKKQNKRKKDRRGEGDKK